MWATEVHNGAISRSMADALKITDLENEDESTVAAFEEYPHSMQMTRGQTRSRTPVLDTNIEDMKREKIKHKQQLR